MKVQPSILKAISDFFQTPKANEAADESRLTEIVRVLAQWGSEPTPFRSAPAEPGGTVLGFVAAWLPQEFG